MRRALLLATVLALIASGAPPSASADERGRIDFAAGEQFVGVPTGSFNHTDAAYWTERRDLSSYSPAVWQALHAYGASVSVQLRYQRDFGPVPKGRPAYRDALPLLRAAARYRVPVNAWLVLPYADGYWAYEGNAKETDAAVRSFVAWAHVKKLRFRGVLLDLESSLQDTRTFAKLRSDPATVAQTFGRNTSPIAQCTAARSYAAIARYIRAHGYRALAAAYPFVLDDIADGNLALQDGLNLPLFVKGEFDTVGFMTMRTVMEQLTGADPGPSLQADYQASIDRAFAREGALTFGVAGDAPYDKLATLAYDVRAGAAVSRNRMGLYSLEALDHHFGPAGLRAVLAAARHPLTGAEAQAAAQPSPGTLFLRRAVSAEDASITAGTPAAELAHGETPGLPNAYPQTCGLGSSASRASDSLSG